MDSLSCGKCGNATIPDLPIRTGKMSSAASRQSGDPLARSNAASVDFPFPPLSRSSVNLFWSGAGMPAPDVSHSQG